MNDDIMCESESMSIKKSFRERLEVKKKKHLAEIEIIDQATKLFDENPKLSEFLDIMGKLHMSVN